MNKKIVTFTMSLRQSQFEVDRLEAEAKKLGVGVNRSLYKDLTFNLENGNPSKSPFNKGDLKNKARVFVRGEEINGENTLGMWFRVAGTKSGKYTEGRNLAIRLLGQTQGSALTKKPVFAANHEGYLNWTRMGKIAQHGVFLENNIPVIPTKIFYTREQILNPSVLRTSPLEERETFGDWEFPIIAKHEKGYQGKSVRKFESIKEVEKFVNKINEKNLGMFLWQKCLPTRWDLRIIVLDGKAIGAMKRSAVGDEFRSNFSLGGEVEHWDLSESDREIAEKVAKICGLDYCGVDIMKDNEGESYVLEVNRQCQFQGFEKSTGINVAKLVVEMFLKRQ